jgi:predicted flap endonuclease-1-like 5' DNA nuclease
MAAEQRQRLADDRDRLASGTAVMLSDFQAAHQAMAAEQRQRLADDRDRLASGTAVMLSGFQAAHQAMAAEQRQRLADDRDRLASDVAEMRSGLQADLSEAQRVWRNFTILMQQRRARKPAPPSPVRKVVAPPPPPPVEEVAPSAAEVVPDDLTAIRGIGSKMQRLLNEAGIYTFAELAGSTPEDLHALGGAARLANVEEWIAQARELAGQT